MHYVFCESVIILNVHVTSFLGLTIVSRIYILQNSLLFVVSPKNIKVSANRNTGIKYPNIS